MVAADLQKLVAGRVARGIVSVLVFILPACTDRTSDLRLQIHDLQDQLDRARAEVDATESSRQGTTEEKANVFAAGSETDLRAEIGRSYETAAREFRRQLESGLGDTQLKGFTLFQPRIESYPFHSEFSVEVSIRGKPVQIRRVPVKARLDGNWIFPTVGEVTSLIDLAKNSPAGQQHSPSTASVPETPAPARLRGATLVAPDGADQTVVIQWSDGTGARTISPPPEPAERAAATERLAEPSTPQSESAPTRVMPSAQDVLIKF